MKAKVGDLGTRMVVRDGKQSLMADMFADDTVLLAETERMLERIENEADSL